MKVIRILSLLLLALLASNSAWAQSDYNPENPPEPMVKYKLTLHGSPADKVYVSGAGKYQAGDWVYINSSAATADYEFRAWMEGEDIVYAYDGVSFLMPDHDVELTAVYELVEYNPPSPDEPHTTYSYKLYLEADPAFACSFNQSSGTPYKDGSEIWVAAYPNQGYVFDGWYNGKELVSEDLDFSLTMPSENVKLVAKFHYDPSSPDEPTGSDEGGDVSEPEVIEAMSVNLSKSTVTIKEGDALQIIATVRPRNTTDPTVVWTSSDEQVATVSANGVVVGKSAGEAVITATCGSAAAECKVTVEAVIPDYVLGDANGDGGVTMADVAVAIDYFLEKKPAHFVLEAADINGDGAITMADVAGIIDIFLRKK